MDSKFFGRAARSAMPKRDPLGKDSEVAVRLRAVMVAEHIPTQDAFAAKLEVEKKRLNNAMVGYPLSIDLAVKIKKAVPGMTRDWLYDGDEAGLPVSLRDRLRQAEMTVRDGSGRSTKKRSTTSVASRSTSKAS
jgi:hypothetical protein